MMTMKPNLFIIQMMRCDLLYLTYIILMSDNLSIH